MSTLPTPVMDYAQDTLAQLVALPSVSAEGRAGQETTQLIKALFEELGLSVQIHPTPGAVVVYAEGGSEGPTLLCYNHYDVQPADPLELWESDPFTLTLRDGKLFGRGAHDDKGELVARLAALRWIKQEHGQIPFRVKFCIEGEEEVGSPNLEPYVEQHQDLLKADAVIWEAGSVDAADNPLITCGLKGIVGLELRVKAAAYDLHSSYGAVVQNPLYRLAAAIASLRDSQGRVLVKGFYDQVRPLSELEEETFGHIPDESPQLAREFGVAHYLGSVSGTAFYRKLLAEPCININGIHGGYGGPGSKTVLPAEAFAKLDVRLVPDQDPRFILQAIKQHLLDQGFSDVEVTESDFGERPARSDLSSSWVKMAQEALREVYSKEPVVWPNFAGSGPMYPFTHVIGAPVIGIGIGYPGSKIHSPNEHIRVSDFEKGILALKRLMEKFAGLK